MLMNAIGKSNSECGAMVIPETKQVSGSEVASSAEGINSISAINSSTLPVIEDYQQHVHDSLMANTMNSDMDTSSSLQVSSQDRNLETRATGMDCEVASHTPIDNSPAAIHNSLEGVIDSVGCCKSGKNGKITCSNSTFTYGIQECTQGVCSAALAGKATANAYVKIGLMNTGKSALSSNSSLPLAAVNHVDCDPSMRPMEMKNSVMKVGSNLCTTNSAGCSRLADSTGELLKQFLNEDVRNLHGKGCLLRDAMVPRHTPQNYNGWKKSEHMQVDENDLKHISDDGSSLAFDLDAYETNKGKLEKGLIGKIIGRKLPLHILDQELSRRWSFVGGFRTVLLSGDYFLCIFESMEARDTILWGGPWQILGHIIGLDKWSPDFNSNSLNGLSSPIWVRLPKLPLLFWDKKTISRIGAMIGKPLWIDAQTTVWGRCEYARVCVRMDLSKRLPTGVWIQEHSSRFFQPIEYEGITLLCFHCGIVGHKAESCPKNHTSGTNVVNTYIHSTAGETTDDGASKTLKAAMLGSSRISKEVSIPHAEEPSIVKTSGSITQPDTLKGEKDYGPWILVTRKRKPVRNSGKFHPPNFRTPPVAPIGVVPSSLAASNKEGMVVDSLVVDHDLKAQVDSTVITTAQTIVGSPPHLDTTTIVENLEATTSRQPCSRSGKERVSKAHFEKELLQLGPIALKSRKRKKKVTIAGAELCLKDFTQASNSGGGDASPSRGK